MTHTSSQALNTSDSQRAPEGVTIELELAKPRPAKYTCMYALKCRQCFVYHMSDELSTPSTPCFRMY